MLDMGFVHDVRRVVAALPSRRQTLFFSATIARPIEILARTMLVDPARVSIAPTVTTAEGVDQSVFFVEKADKRRSSSASCVRPARAETSLGPWCSPAPSTAPTVCRSSSIGPESGSAAIHGNKSQGARERALDAFRRGTTEGLVATDVAARGIDVEGVSLVVNFDLPNVAESYVHRIGRTGRAGATGRAISFCDREERTLLADIERLIRRRLPVAGDERADRGAPTIGAPQQTTNARPPMPNRHRGYAPGQGTQRARER